MECHAYQPKPDNDEFMAPDFTGYGDEQWLRTMIMDPSGQSRYGKRNRMPAFRDLESLDADLFKEQANRDRSQSVKAVVGDAPEEDDKKKEWETKKAKAEKEYDQAHKTVQLPDLERELIVRFLTKNFHVVFGGEPIAPVMK
jgi:hypothetical protein